MSGYGYDSDTSGVNAGRLWAGGLATAAVAGLVIIVGVLIARSVFGIAILAPEEDGHLGNATTGFYAASAALAALLAAGLLHLLLTSAPSPLSFFGWIGGLATAVAAVSPFTQEAALESQVATAAINLVAGVAIVTLLSGVAASAQQFPRRQSGGGGYGSGRRDAWERSGRQRQDGYDPNAETRAYGD
ncbi:DUF6069 family protein [Lipingzhangella sp. LS1_29]|uniref:DUF6069 family protein n=1 Tax=Lipingzhangella rawalii TaxID=2055835 RepID=A0ABU2H3K5_9ACTN|nr:DUF6069 family protein [Lipingzhangella rawalii]MDS1269890.1 DUF6069 family protein [Lipingzhangella rawalii]